MDSTRKARLKILKKYGYPIRTTEEAEIKLDCELLLHHRELCTLGIEAKTNYYKSTVWGKIAHFFQSKLNVFFSEYKTPIKTAEDVITQIDTFLESHRLYVGKVLKRETKDLEACAFLARHLSTITGKTFYLPIGETKSNPEQILIAKTNGDVYAFSRHKEARLGFDTSRAFYEGYFWPHNQSPREVTIITSFPIDGINRGNASQVSKCSEQMKQGLLNLTDYCSIKNEGAEVGFIVADLHSPKLTNLESFLNSIDGKSLNDSQKLDLMESLEKSMNELHKKNKTHRVIREKNILIGFDPITQKIKLAFTSFDSQIDKNLPPEYLAASLLTQLKNKFFATTNPSMDIWNLGLIFYRIWHGTTFFEAMDPEFDRKNKSEQIEKLNKIYKTKDFSKAFKNHPVDIVIRSMLNVDPAKRSLLHSYKINQA